MYSGECVESSSIEPTKHDDPVSNANDTGVALARRVGPRHPSDPRVPPRKLQLRPFSGNDDERKRGEPGISKLCNDRLALNGKKQHVAIRLMGDG